MSDDDPLDGRGAPDDDPLGLDDGSEGRRLDGVKARVGGFAAAVRERVSRDGEGDDESEDGGPSALADAWERAEPVVTSPRAKRIAAGVGAVVVAILAFWFVMSSRGIVAAVLYSFLFVFCATLFPIGINLLGGATPTSVGKFHLLLGAVAFDHHYLVQRDRGWEWCPGERGRVYIDEEWHDVDGEVHYSILGWRPFGILRYKDGETWADKRVDEAGLDARGAFEQDPSAVADGGAVERGGFEAVEPPIISGLDGTWLLDLRRIFTNGVRRIGDVELIETAEEVIERGQVDDGAMSNAGPLVETIGGLILGVIVGYGYLFLMG